jgi:hypothetical protein
MKALLLAAISLFSSPNLKDTVKDVYEIGSPEQLQVGLKILSVKTSDNVFIEVSETLFPTLRAMNNGYTEGVDDSEEYVHLRDIDSYHLNHAINWYTNPDYQAPHLERILHILMFLNPENFLETLYINYLNKNLKAPVLHNVTAKKIYKIICNNRELSESTPRFKQQFSLTKDHIKNITNYKTRKKHAVSIQNLIDAEEIPEIIDGDLNLCWRNIVSLQGLQNIKNIKSVIKIYLGLNHLTTINKNDFIGFDQLQELDLSYNGITKEQIEQLKTIVPQNCSINF